MSRCFKNTNRICDPKRCDMVCYIKLKRYGIDNIFTKDYILKQQNKANIYFIECIEELFDQVIGECVALTREKFNIYPNAKVIHKMVKRLKE